jgi:glycosidase
MQWSTDKHAGFTSGQPWFRVNDTYTECNAAAQVGVSGSPFEHWSAILRLRKELADVFVYGDFEMVDAEHDDVFAYTRSYNGESVLVVCNFRDRPTEWKLPLSSHGARREHLMISTHGDIILDADAVSLRPFEAFACAQLRASSRL